jgi:hypothetical protein
MKLIVDAGTDRGANRLSSVMLRDDAPNEIQGAAAGLLRVASQCPLSRTGFRSAARRGTWVSRRGPMLASGSTRAESAITRIGSCIPTMDQIRKTIPDGLPTGV